MNAHVFSRVSPRRRPRSVLAAGIALALLGFFGVQHASARPQSGNLHLLSGPASGTVTLPVNPCHALAGHVDGTLQTQTGPATLVLEWCAGFPIENPNVSVMSGTFSIATREGSTQGTMLGTVQWQNAQLSVGVVDANLGVNSRGTGTGAFSNATGTVQLHFVWGPGDGFSDARIVAGS